jgi:hypothetical protein
MDMGAPYARTSRKAMMNQRVKSILQTLVLRLSGE